MADQGVLAKITDFFTQYKNPILITIGVLIVLFIIYSFVYPSYPDMEGFHNRGHPSGYGSYQGREGFYVPTNEEANGPKKLILFYAPWCPHCKGLMDGEQSVWQSLLRKYGGRKDMAIDQVNCDEKPEMATQYGIGGFPTIMMFNGGKSYTYDGNRSLEDLEKFIETPAQAQ